MEKFIEVTKKIWPFSWKDMTETKTFVLTLVGYVVATAIGFVLLGVLTRIPVIGWVFAPLGGVIELYTWCGIVLTIFNKFDLFTKWFGK